MNPKPKYYFEGNVMGMDLPLSDSYIKDFDKLKVGSIVEVYLERIESFKGEIVISREKAKRMVAWKKMEKIFETQEEVTGFVTGKVKGGYVCTVDGLPTFMPSSQIDVRPLKKSGSFNECAN